MKYFTLKANTLKDFKSLDTVCFILMSNVSVFGQSAQKVSR
jgi:hypothetical protein